MRIRVVVAVVASVVLVIGNLSCTSAKVSVEVLENVYVLPVAELASTKTYPEIIRITNDVIEVSLIPNRGRILSTYSFIRSEESTPILYQKLNPKPMVLPNGLHVVEFGGYYLSLPWNERDRQPLDLSFAITQARDDMAEVFLSGKDMFKKTLTECWIRVRDASPLVEVEVKITNTSKTKEQILTFKDFMVVDVRDNCRMVLPAEVIEVLESKNNWLGEPGNVLSWPVEAIETWNKMSQYFRVKMKQFSSLPFAGVFYPDRNIFFAKFWVPQDFFSAFEVWSWGQSWPEEPGADAYVVISSVNDNLTLKPQEGISFKVYFTAFEDTLQYKDFQSLFSKLTSFLP